MSKNTEISKTASQEVLAQLAQSFPTDPGALKIQLPRIGFVSQDKTEGKGKAMKVVTEAGTFYLETVADELDEDGKKVFGKEEIGSSIEGIVLFQRKQLKYYDAANNKFISSPVYDSDDEIVPIFGDKKEIARGTPAELKKKYEYTKDDGKVASRLEENKVLYLIYKGEKYQMTIRGSSMYAFKSYCKTTQPNTVVTKFSSEAKENGSIAWNQMTFKAVRPLNAEEAEVSLKEVMTIKAAIEIEKQTYASTQKKTDELDGYEKALKAIE